MKGGKKTLLRGYSFAPMYCKFFTETQIKKCLTVAKTCKSESDLDKFLKRFKNDNKKELAVQLIMDASLGEGWRNEFLTDPIMFGRQPYTTWFKEGFEAKFGYLPEEGVSPPPIGIGGKIVRTGDVILLDQSAEMLEEALEQYPHLARFLGEDNYANSNSGNINDNDDTDSSSVLEHQEHYQDDRG